VAELTSGRVASYTTLRDSTLAKALDDATLLSDLEALDPVPQAALLGTLNGLAQHRDEAWADEVLQRWLQTPTLAGLVVAAVHRLPATNRRARLATDAVDRGASTATELGRLLYGAWTRPLTEAAVVGNRGTACSSRRHIRSGTWLGAWCFSRACVFAG
jgi:hypothetical protein